MMREALQVRTAQTQETGDGVRNYALSGMMFHFDGWSAFSQETVLTPHLPFYPCELFICY